MAECSICGRRSEVSVNCLVSTRGTRPRVQKCSHSLLFCRMCVATSRTESRGQVASGLLEALEAAYAGVQKRIQTYCGGAE